MVFYTNGIREIQDAFFKVAFDNIFKTKILQVVRTNKTSGFTGYVPCKGTECLCVPKIKLDSILFLFCAVFRF